MSTVDSRMHLLFVCTGNICRSPTAERLVRAHADERALPWLTASSCGTRAVTGAAMDPGSEAALRALGGDGSDFRASQLAVEHVRSADLVLTMTARHRARVLELEPAALRRTFTLLEAARLCTLTPGPGPLVGRLTAARAQHGTRLEEDVADPYRAGQPAHELAAATIDAALRPLLDALDAAHQAGEP